LWVEPSTPRIGEEAVIHASVKNIGNAPATAETKVKVTVDNKTFYYPPGQTHNPPLPVGAGCEAFVCWTPDHVSNNLGITAEVDYAPLPNGEIAESDESNNRRELYISTLPSEEEAPSEETQPQPMPTPEDTEQQGADLELLSGTLEFSAPDFKVGKEIKVAAKVKNTGTKKLVSVEVAFWADEEKIGEDSVAGLDSGEKKRFTIFWTPRQPGQYTIYAIADPNKRFDEVDEGNNRDERVITINAD
jgi:subtilase family serine protease